MKIGIAGPVDVSLLAHLFDESSFPRVYSFPLIALLVLELWKRGHEITVFSGSTEVVETHWFQGRRIRLCVVPYRKRRRAYDFYRQEKELLAEEMKASDCEIIHAHWLYEFGAAALRAGKPYLVTSHDAPLNILRFMLRRKIWLHWLCRTALGAKVAHRAEHLSAVSPYVQRHLQRWFSPRAKMIPVTPNGVKAEIFKKDSRPDNREDNKSQIVICSVLTGWGRLKNTKVALKAFDLVRGKYPQTIYRIFGRGHEKGGPAHQWARKQGLDVNVEFIGNVPYERLLEEVSRSTIFLHPTLEEAHPVSVCEALALGVPVVGGKRSGGVPFTLNYGKAGVLVNVKSPEDIARGIELLLENPSLQKELGKRARKYAWENFTVEKMVDRYEALYEKILEEEE